MFPSVDVAIPSLRKAGMLNRPRMARIDVKIADSDYLLKTADSWFAAGSLNLAQECYNRASQLAPFKPEPYFGLGCVAVQKGLHAEASLAFELARWLKTNDY